jgi:hypothetical protein
MSPSTNELNSDLEHFEENTKFHLDPSNRWVILSKIIPWSELSEENGTLSEGKKGRPTKPFRVTLGCLLIQRILNLSDARNRSTNQKKSLSTILFRVKML